MSDQCTKGTNWGHVSIDDKTLSLKHNQQSIIKLPLKKVINSNTQKNDIVLQLNTEDCGDNDDMLCEVRFYIPPQEVKQKLEKKRQEGEIEEEDDEEEAPTFQQTLQQEILTKAKIGQTSADSILTIADVPLTVPRGKYTMDFFTKDIRFHGSTYQFTTDYKGIYRFFMLPMPDEINMSLVIGLEKPFKQGQTAYNFIVMQFKRETESDIKLKYNKAKLEEIGWKDILEEYSGPLHESVGEILSGITGIKVVMAKNFKNKNGQLCIRCSVGPHSGYLFPLEKSLIYISKPVIWIRHEDIKEVVLQRIGSTNLNKFFDMKILYKNSQQLFSAIERDELDNLTNYFQSKKINVRKIQEEPHQLQLQESDDDDEIDDDDSRQQENKVMKCIFQKANRPNQGNLDSSEDDEDFQAEDNDEQSSGSDESDEPEEPVKQVKKK